MMSNRNFLQWYAERTTGEIPEITVWNAPLWIYKGIMLLWAVWLAASFIQWLRWGWAAYRTERAARARPAAHPKPTGQPPSPLTTPHAPQRSGDHHKRARLS